MGIRRAGPRMRRLLASAMCMLIAGCAAPDLGAPQYAQDDCTVRRLTDSLTGETVSGAEDLAQDGEHVWVSAYDRLAAEEALQKGRALADGGLYRISLKDLVRGDVDVASALDPDAIGGLRPHGIAAKDNRLAVVNRRGGADRAQAVLEIYDIEEGRLRPRLAISNAAYCAANGCRIFSEWRASAHPRSTTMSRLGV